MAYSEKVLDHYNNPRNVGTMSQADPTVGTGMVGAPACGDVMKLQIKVVDDVMSKAIFLPKVIEYDRFQPEFYENTHTYIKKRTNKNF